MKTIAVLGGGPAGAFAAELLASAGLNTILVDEKLAWEKPCGGGVTFKAYDRYPFLLHNDVPKRLVETTTMAAPGARPAALKLSHPLLIYSRMDLNRMLLQRAERAGARIEKARVHELVQASRGWRVRTNSGMLEADYCIVATGARNPLRNVGTELTPADTMCALGYYIEAEQDHIDIQFLPKLEGYIWVFPRCGHLSVGICGKGVPAQQLRRSLEDFMTARGISWKGARFYSHLLPSLGTTGWMNNRLSGEGWLAVGDAGGLVDPITGEGLYYALRSSDLATQTLISDLHAPADAHKAYRALLSRDFGADLAFGAAFARRFFLGTFLFRSVPQRMVQFLHRSPRFRELVQDLMAGRQTYLGLKARILKNLHGTLVESFVNFVLGREVAGEPGV